MNLAFAQARAWLGLCALLAAGGLLAGALPSAALDWQPSLAASEPWRAWSAAWVHWSLLHLLANLAGCAVLGALGLSARLGTPWALAWFATWPLTQWGLLLLPTSAGPLHHFGGLSGVLHAGVAVATVALLQRPGRDRHIGLAIAAGLIAKLWLEQAWTGPALREVAGWDIAVVPFSHFSGAVAGGLCGLVAGWRSRGEQVNK
ncbi:rhomboid family intramembrane serine protease [Paucibacter sp. B51]|uniref:rhomboid family intramembrane serine protease n=1 Tax=Paucibacter sp. B51 TaxID=2993315 RepID=UPI0022EBF0D9|nr:rhomboid family intramembrane serine protease [Paucibacter sp. B51]